MIIPINGSFEQGFTGWPVRELGPSAWQLSTDESRSGGQSLKAIGRAGPSRAARTAMKACRPGDTIVASGYIKRVGSSQYGVVRVSFWDASGAELYIAYGNRVEYSDWQKSLVRVTVPEDMYLFRVDLAAVNPAGTDLYFDDITLEVLQFDYAETVGMSVPALPTPNALGRSRVATQYTESPRFLAYLNALLDPLDNIQQTLLLNLIQTDVEQANGYNLDVLGEIVGVSRIVPNAIALEFFGFDDAVVSATFGEEGLLYYGARFRDEYEPAFESSVLADPEYRLLIKSRILRNHARGTNEDIIAALLFLLNIDVIIVDDNGGMEIGLTFGRQLTVAEIAMIDELLILPRPAAVKIRRRMMFLPGKYFGFDGQPGALGFGEESDPTMGGPLAEEF